jgi:methylglutaconyl-CoA hydratase
VRNAFNDEVIAELTAVFGELAKRDEVRCIVLAGNGPRLLRRRRPELDEAHGHLHARGKPGGRLPARAHAGGDLPLPQAHHRPGAGDVYAGGTGLVAACDIAVSVDTAQFCLSEVRLGLIPATISPYVIRAMGARAAHPLVPHGRARRCRRGAAHRLVHEVVTAEALDAKTAEIAQALVNAGPEAVKALQEAAARRGRPRDHRGPGAPHGGRHRRHPRQRRRPRRHPVLPRQAQAQQA